ncbi:hypothetical protein [Thermomonospora catenispora]|uniref:hypothetical protein n=1 Tax=Thermomonospora catenispora TaxID=2493090 RepID=UPI001F4F86BA
MARRLREAIPDRQRPDFDTVLSYVKRWEAGRVNVSERYRFAYAAAFDMDVDELFGPQQDIRTAASGVPAVPQDLLDAAGLSDRARRPVDARYVEAIRQTNQALIQLDTLHGGGSLLQHAVRVFREVHHKVGAGTCDPKVERDLVAVAGETGEIAAWIAYDADRQTTSRQLINEALLLSRQAGDRAMELFELGHLSMLSLRAHRPAEALRIADELADDGRLAPRVAALFEIRRGRALAQMGEEHRAMAALDKAQVMVSAGISARDPHWTWWIDDMEIDRQRSAALAQLGRWRQVVPLREEVVARVREGPAYARFDLAELLDALVHVRDWSRAEEILGEAVDLAATLGPCRTTALLRETVTRIDRSSGASSTVIDAADRIRYLVDNASQHRLL